MLENVLNLINGPVKELISNNQSIPEEKKTQAVNVTTHAVAEGLGKYLTADNMSKLAGLFNGGTVTTGSNSIVQSVESAVASALTQKVGLSGGIATAIATTVVPAVMNIISGKINDPNEKGFNLESLIHTFTTGSNDKGGILGTLGKLFG